LRKFGVLVQPGERTRDRVDDDDERQVGIAVLLPRLGDSRQEVGLALGARERDRVGNNRERVRGRILLVAELLAPPRRDPPLDRRPCLAGDLDDE
jgi:hypothetical protein